MAQVWSTEQTDIEQALTEPNGRSFRRVDGTIVDTIRHRGIEGTVYPYRDESTRLYYTAKGGIFHSIPGTHDEDIVAVLMPEQVETWASLPADLEDAILNADGRVFRDRAGKIVDDVRTYHPGVSCTNKFPAYSTQTGWYYQTNGFLYEHRESPHDLMSVKIEVRKPGQEIPVEDTGNPDFLRLLSFAKDEQAAELIRKEFANYRLLDTLHLKALGFTGKRKTVTWEANSKRWALLDIDAMCDSVPWVISDGEDIHEVFEEHRPGSCMRDGSKHELRQLYAQNPDKVKTAHHAKGSHGLLQSAISCLVWYGKDKVYLDRRYTDGYLPMVKEPLIRSLARQLKAQTGKDVLLVWKGDDINGIDTTSIAVQFTLNRDSDLMPWCDSIRYMVEYDDNTVTLSTSEKNGRMCCQDQSGTDITESPCKCCSCRCAIDEDNSRTNESGNTYCVDCYSETFSYCSWNEEDYSADDVSEVRIFSYGSAYQHRRSLSSLGHRDRVATRDTMHISNDALSSHFAELQDGTYCHNDLVIEDNRGNYYAPDDEGNYVVTEDGETYHPDDVCQTVDDQIHPKENCQELHDGTWCLSEYAVEIDGEWYHDDGRPEPEQALDDSEDTAEEPQQEDGLYIPPGYRLAEPGEILPDGSRYLQEYPNIVQYPSEWTLSNECGRAYGQTSFGARIPYIIPVDDTADTRKLDIVFPSTESSVTR